MKSLLTMAHWVTQSMAPLVRLAANALSPLLRLWRLSWLVAWSHGVVPASTQFDGPTRVPKRIALNMGPHCRLGRDIFMDTNEAGSITLGKHVRINAGSVLVSHAAISIGDDCLIGEYVSIRDANHGTQAGHPMRLQPHVSAPITIGRNVWVGRGSVILKGVSIGDGAVVAANSVVTRSVAAGTLVGGVPARLIRAAP
jgi:acetyltransferase-like isoleucine patch superfamily enzyme